MPLTTILLATLLTSLGDLANAVADDSANGRTPFCVTGAVECTVPFQEHFLHLVVSDEKHALDIPGTLRRRPPDLGDIVEITGKIESDRPGHRQPFFDSVHVVGHTTPPEPVVGDVGVVLTEERAFRRSILVGELRDVVPSATNPCWLYLFLVTPSGSGIATIPNRGAHLADLERLIGATLALTGYPGSYNSSIRFPDDRLFTCAGTNEITVVSPVPADPFSAAPSVNVLRRIRPEKYSQYGRHRARGHILAMWQSRHAIIKLEDTRIIQADFNEPAFFARNTPVEVVGYPIGDAFHLRLTRAIVRRSSMPFRVETPVFPITDKSIDHNLSASILSRVSLQGTLCEVEGKILSFTEEHRRLQVFPLEIGGHVISVDYSCAPDLSDTLISGCTIRMTATCVLETESWATGAISMKLNGINFVLDRPSDLVIVARPPWWTPERLTAVVILLLLAVVGCMVWNRMLHHLSEKRGRELFLERSASALAELRTEERTRLAMELHDSLSQILTGAAMQLDAGEIGVAKRILASCRRELRSCLWDLRSKAIDAKRFADAVRETLAPHLGSRCVSIDLDFPSSSISESLRHAALCIIREAAVNAVRHGRATTIAVSGELNGRKLAFSVVDDGRGFDPTTAQGSRNGHFGILGMHERAKAFNGSVEIDSSPGNGTIVNIEMEDKNPEVEIK